MNTSGEVADLMVKEGLQITDEVVKLTGLGAKNLAAIIIALLKEDNKIESKYAEIISIVILISSIIIFSVLLLIVLSPT